MMVKIKRAALFSFLLSHFLGAAHEEGGQAPAPLVKWEAKKRGWIPFGFFEESDEGDHVRALFSTLHHNKAILRRCSELPKDSPLCKKLFSQLRSVPERRMSDGDGENTWKDL